MRADLLATSPTRNLMRELLLVSWFLARRIPVSWFLAWRKCRQESIGCGKCDTQVVRQMPRHYERHQGPRRRAAGAAAREQAVRAVPDRSLCRSWSRSDTSCPSTSAGSSRSRRS
jgi:hypothetical protein